MKRAARDDEETTAAPYVGLRPYEESDRKRFFGRAHDAERLINKIFSARLTLFYAPSAAGKTSLLRTLIVPDLGAQDAEVVYFDHWSCPDPLATLTEAIEASAGPGPSLEASPGDGSQAGAGAFETSPPARGAPATGLESACAALVEVRGQTLVLLLDQFEEFLQRYRAAPDPLRRELAALVRGKVDVRVVVSFREEFLGAVDACLRDHIPARPRHPSGSTIPTRSSGGSLTTCGPEKRDDRPLPPPPTRSACRSCRSSAAASGRKRRHGSAGASASSSSCATMSMTCMDATGSCATISPR